MLPLAKLRRQAQTGELSSLAWLAAFDQDDREQFFSELLDALSIVESTQDVRPVETCLREWHTTAQALADPLRNAVLIGPEDKDYTDVERPRQLAEGFAAKPRGYRGKLFAERQLFA